MKLVCVACDNSRWLAGDESLGPCVCVTPAFVLELTAMYEAAEKDLSDLHDTFDAKVREETQVQRGAADDFEARLGAAGDALRAALVSCGWDTHGDGMGGWFPAWRELADLLL